MDISKINLNLLKVFGALLHENNVTIAARKLYLSQSATSTALSQLRKVLNDPLFIREGNIMKPTSYAKSLSTEVQHALHYIENVFSRKESFNPKLSAKEFTIGTSEYSQVVIVPNIVKAINKISTNIKVSAVSFRTCSTENPFANNSIDLGVGISRRLPDDIHSEVLFTESPVCIAHKDNPLFRQKFTMKKYLNAKHVQWCCDVFNVQSITDIYFERNNLIRNSSIKASNLLSCLIMLKEDKNLISTVPSRLATKLCHSFDLRAKPVPFKCPEATVSLFWPKKYTLDSGLQWFLQEVRKVANSVIEKKT